MTEISDERILQTKVFLRPDEVARILRISKRMVYYHCEMGTFECVKIGRTLRIKTESLKNLLKNSS